MHFNRSVRDHLIANLHGGQCCDMFEDVVAAFASSMRGQVPAGAEHSAWQTVEHMRISQRDLLDYSRNFDGSYKEKRWPQEYWPVEVGPADDAAWTSSVETYLADRAEFEALIGDPNVDPTAPFAWSADHTLMREALLAASHASYHIGQLVLLHRLIAVSD